MPPTPLQAQLIWLAVLALPVATIAWTVTHEDLFKEPRDWAVRRSRDGQSYAARKFFYICTCEYCFSHDVAAGFVWLTGFRLLLLEDWRGYLVAWFALVAVANLYISFYGRLRVDIKSERLEAEVKEQELAEKR